MSAPRIRAAGRQDVAAIVAMLADDPLGSQREVVREPPAPCYLDAFAAIDRDPNELLAVIELEHQVVGCLQLSFVPGLSHQGAWRGVIEGVRVARAFRNRGLGRALIGWAVEQCRRQGCRQVQLTTHKSRRDAQRFYAALGFAATHEGMKLDLQKAAVL